MMYSELIPNNLGVIYRKEYVDLEKSTIKDFENYTGRTVDSKRSCKIPNAYGVDSQILFMHIEEINNIQNLNLGWFAIEQYDELESDHEFFMLLGRLRRKVIPSEEFKKAGLPDHSGFVIGNAGEHSGKKIWKLSTDLDFPIIEADTYEMEDVLPADYFKGLDKIATNRPEIFRKYVLNSWDISSLEFALIKGESLAALKDIQWAFKGTKRIVSCDPSLGGDECVIQAIENGHVMYQEIMHENDETKIAARIAGIGSDWNTNDYVVDAIGIGHGVYTFLCKLVSKKGGRVSACNSAMSANNKELYFNKKTEMWFYTSQQILDKKLPYPSGGDGSDDDGAELRRQLMGVKYEPIMRRGKVRVEEKQKTKKTLKCSPDRADAFVQGIYYLQFVESKNYVAKPMDRYEVYKTEEKNEGVGICNF